VLGQIVMTQGKSAVSLTIQDFCASGVCRFSQSSVAWVHPTIDAMSCRRFAMAGGKKMHFGMSPCRPHWN
jgi:hypothetical protein